LKNFATNKKKKMGQIITIDYPESLAFSLKMENLEFKREMKIISLIKLYELGKISSGIAAKLLDMSRVDFLELLGKYNVSYFHNGLENELESDFANA
jgi:predicted HTH domain antitoxin